MKLHVFVCLLFFPIILIGQEHLECNSFGYLKGKKMIVLNPGQESWFKFRAKGKLLDFVGLFEQKDSLFEYQIYPFENCQKIKLGEVIPLRSTFKNSSLITEEIWKKVVEEGICSCSSCLFKIEIDDKKSIQLEQGKFYFLRVLSKRKSFEFELEFSEIDTLNPIQFSIDSMPFEEIEIGMIYQLREIFFIPATPKYLDKSIPELKKLEHFLKKHNALMVQVRGHVNGSAQIKPSFYQSLSNERALAVKKFLVKNGVDSLRVDARGMSNFQMRYPSPKTPFQAEENRRVEILILAVE